MPVYAFALESVTVTVSPAARASVVMSTAMQPSIEMSMSALLSYMADATLSPAETNIFFTLPATFDVTVLLTVSSAASFISSSSSSSSSERSASAVRTVFVFTEARMSPTSTLSPRLTYIFFISTPSGTVTSTTSSSLSVPDPLTDVLIVPEVTSAEVMFDLLLSPYFCAISLRRMITAPVITTAAISRAITIFRICFPVSLFLL